MNKSNKTMGELLQFYYVWKKLPRYNLCQNRKRSTISANNNQNMYNIPTVPIKPDEPNRQTVDHRLRNKPRVDYSVSSNGSHYWNQNAPINNGVVRKRKRLEDIENPCESHLGVFDVSVYAGIDHEKLSQIKRMRLGLDPYVEDPLVDDISLSSEESFWDDNENQSSSVFEENQGPSSLSDQNMEVNFINDDEKSKYVDLESWDQQDEIDYNVNTENINFLSQKNEIKIPKSIYDGFLVLGNSPKDSNDKEQNMNTIFNNCI